MGPEGSLSQQAVPSANTREAVDEAARESGRGLFLKKVIPQTTSGFLSAIMLSVLLPLLLLQAAIYFFWYKTRNDAEMDTNLEIARSVGSSFESHVHDIRRQQLVLGNAIRYTPFSPEEIGNLLTILKKQYSTAIRFSLVDHRGDIVASSDPRAVGLSVANRSYYRDFKSGRDWTITDLSTGLLQQSDNFCIASKVSTRDGYAGMIVAVIDPGKLGDLVLTLDRPEEGIFTLFDRAGNLVYFGGNLRVGHPNLKSSDPLLREAMRGREAAGRIPYPLTKVDHIVARVPIRGLGWTAGASRPVAAAMAPIYRNLTWIAGLNGLILIVSLLAATGLSRFLIGRLHQLRGYARAIAGGDFSSRAQVTNPVELAELGKAFNRMADQVQARQESLEKAVGDLTRSNQELEQFAYVASHDLQEPLRVITGFLQLIEKRYTNQLDAEGVRYMGYITDAVARQQQLIRDLLAYSRLEWQAGNLKPVDAGVAVRAASHNIGQMIQDTNAHLTYDKLPTVRADAMQLVQLFQNLISNAIKFRGSEHPEVHISAHAEDGDWVFSVRDNGIGIEKEYWDQIFTMFRRLHTKKEYPGTGIGLAICKKIVERHGGRIWLDSIPGEGTTFYFTLVGVEES